MRRPLPLLLAVAGVALATVLTLRSRESPPPVPTPSPPRDTPLAAAPPPGVARPPLLARALRAGSEVVVLVVRPPWGAPAARVTVACADIRATTDGAGTCRLSGLEAGAAELQVGEGAERVVLPLPAAELPGPGTPGLFCVTPAAGPGGRAVFLSADGEAPMAVRFVPEDPDDPVVPSVVVPPTEAGHPSWRRLDVRLPADLAPGRLVCSSGLSEVSLPVAPGAPTDAGGEMVPDPGRPPPYDPPEGTGGAVRLVLTDAAAEVSLPGAEEGAPVLVAVRGGGRLLAFASGTLTAGTLRLPLGRWDRPEGPVTATAVVAGPAGFREVEVPAPGGGGPALVVDLSRTAGGIRVAARIAPAPGEPGPVAHFAVVLEHPSASEGEAAAPPGIAVSGPLREFAVVFQGTPSDGPVRARALARVVGSHRVLDGTRELPATASRTGGAAPAPWRPGDEPSGPRAATPLPAGPRVEVPCFVRPGEATALPEAPADGGWTWRILAPPSASGPLRLWLDGGLAFETFVRPDDGDAPAPRAGPFDAALVPRPGARAVLQATVPGLEGFVLSLPRALDARTPASAAGGVRVEAAVPASVPPGEVVDTSLTVTAEASVATATVRWALPAGFVPAEEAWRLRRRSPPGTRVEPAPGEWVLSLPRLPPGETRFVLRLRAVHPGRYGVPPAVVLGPGGALGWSAGAQVDVPALRALADPTMRR